MPAPPQHLSDWLDLVEKITKLGSVTIVFMIVVMGLVFRSGAKSGRRRGDTSRTADGKPILHPIGGGEKTMVFWKDESLILGGLRAVQLAGVLCIYVVIMGGLALPLSLLGGSFNPELASTTIAGLLCYPVAMMSTVAIISAHRFLRLFGKPLLIPAIASALLGLASFTVYWWTVPGAWQLGIQGGMLLIQAFIVSYFLGIAEGVRDSNFDQRLPLIVVDLIDGTQLAGLRMGGLDDSHYRFIQPDGAECIMPTDQVRAMRVKV